MEKLEIGKFVISKGRLHIGQIIDIDYEKEEVKLSIGSNVGRFETKMSYDWILKCDSEVINLIEIGDIVNGYTIEEITQDVISGKKKLLTGHWKYNFQGDGTLLQFYNEDIKRITTKEKYDTVCDYIVLGDEIV